MYAKSYIISFLQQQHFQRSLEDILNHLSPQVWNGVIHYCIYNSETIDNIYSYIWPRAYGHDGYIH